MKTTEKPIKPANVREIAKKRSEILHISPKAIVRDESLNLRTSYGKDPEDLELIEYVRHNGPRFSPLLCFNRNGEICISDGYRRHYAVMVCLSEGLDIQTIPIQMAEKNYCEREMIFDVFSRNAGKALSPLEKSEGVRRAIAFGYTPAEIAKRLGITEATVSNYRILASAPPKVQEAIKEDKIASSLVVDISRECTKPEELEKAVETAVKTAKKDGRGKATKKHVKNKEAEEVTIRVGKLKLVGFLEDILAALKSESETKRQKAIEEVEQWHERYSE